jgi:hypothetical protein
MPAVIIKQGATVRLPKQLLRQLPQETAHAAAW